MISIMEEYPCAYNAHHVVDLSAMLTACAPAFHTQTLLPQQSTRITI